MGRFCFEQATRSELEAMDVVLLDGELVIEKDTGLLKVGDGVRFYRELPYLNRGEKGDTPNIKISDEGTWVIDGVDTKKPSRGETGAALAVKGTKESTEALLEKGAEGDAYMIGGDLYVWSAKEWTNVGRIQGAKGDKGETGPRGEKGDMPKLTISNAGTWEIDGVDTQKAAVGPKGDIGPEGPRGYKGDKGDPLRYEDLEEWQVSDLRERMTEGMVTQEELEGKVDKVEGKVLSENSFTSEHKDFVESEMSMKEVVPQGTDVLSAIVFPENELYKYYNKYFGTNLGREIQTFEDLMFDKNAFIEVLNNYNATATVFNALGTGSQIMQFPDAIQLICESLVAFKIACDTRGFIASIIIPVLSILGEDINKYRKAIQILGDSTIGMTVISNSELILDKLMDDTYLLETLFHNPNARAHLLKNPLPVSFICSKYKDKELSDEIIHCLNQACISEYVDVETNIFHDNSNSYGDGEKIYTARGHEILVVLSEGCSLRQNATEFRYKVGGATKKVFSNVIGQLVFMRDGDVVINHHKRYSPPGVVNICRA